MKERGKICTEQPVQRRGGMGSKVYSDLKEYKEVQTRLELGLPGEELARDEGSAWK